MIDHKPHYCPDCQHPQTLSSDGSGRTTKTCINPECRAKYVEDPVYLQKIAEAALSDNGSEGKDNG